MIYESQSCRIDRGDEIGYIEIEFQFQKEGFTIRSDQFKALISDGGLKTTRQRREIFDIFQSTPGHKNLAQIHALVTQLDPKIGYITVYRTMKLLTRLGLAAQRKFGDGETQYEPVSSGEHHDHFICLSCGKIIEFEDEALENLQNGVARRYRFKILHHRLELYGRCNQCAQKKGNRRRKR